MIVGKRALPAVALTSDIAALTGMIQRHGADRALAQQLRTLARHSLHAAVDDMGIAESLHQVIFHWIIDDLYRRISGPVAVPANGTARVGA